MLTSGYFYKNSKGEIIMKNEKPDVLASVESLFLSWTFKAMFSHEDSDPTSKRDELLESSFYAKLLIHKLEWAGVDIVIPDELLGIIALCSSTPAEVQMIAVDIFDAALERNDFTTFPKGYVVKSFDFSYAFPDEFPITEIYPFMKEKYDKKWDDQKIPADKRGIFRTDNLYDTMEFWKKYRSE